MLNNRKTICQPKQKMTIDKNAKLPDPIMLQDQNNSLHVPNTSPRMTFRDQLHMMDEYSRLHTWNDREIYQLPRYSSLGLNGYMSRADIQYQERSRIENQRLSATMSDEQKQMLADIETMFPASNLKIDN